MIYLNEQQTSQLISHQLAYDAVKEAFIAAVSDEATLFPVVNAAGPQEGSMFSLKSACISNLVGWKTGTYWPNNRALDMPCHGTTVFLLKPDTGEFQAAIAASKVNAYRTAAADAVAVDYLSRKDSKILAVFGTGHQAEFEVLAICDIRKIEIVLVVGRSNTEAFVEKLKQQGINAESVSAQTACEQADIIVTATTAQSPLFDAQWVKGGTHISAMGADKVGKQELPPELYNTARLFCDYKMQSVAIGEFQHTVNPLVTEIGLVITGNAQGRKTDKEITVFDSSGIAIQDLFVAAKLLDLVDRKAAE